MIPTTAEVRGAGEAAVLVACFYPLEVGAVLHFAKEGAGVGHELGVVIERLFGAIGAEGEDAEGHFGIVESSAPGLDHLGEDLAIHEGAFGAFEAVVVSLVEDGSFNRQSFERSHHAGVAITGTVGVEGWSGAKVIGRGAVSGDFLAILFHAGDPLVVLFNAA